MSLHPDCYYGDHLWNGTSVCQRGCGARLRCACGCYVREDNVDAHLKRCPWYAAAGADEIRQIQAGWPV